MFGDRIVNARQKFLPLLEKSAGLAESLGKAQKAKEIVAYKSGLNNFRYKIALIGYYNRGKSTLLNSFLGRNNTQLAPVHALACTAAIAYYYDVSLHPQHREGVIVTFADGSKQEGDVSSLSQYINNANNKNNAKKVEYIEIFSEFPMVGDRAVMVDTPGRGTVYEEHDLLSDQVLPQADAIIMLTASNLPMEAGEKLFLQRQPESIKQKITFVMTMKDRLKTQKDYNDGMEYVKKQLGEAGVQCNRIYSVAAKPVVDALERNASETEIQELKKEHGIAELEMAIGETIRNGANEQAMLKSMLVYGKELSGFFEKTAAVMQEEIDQYSASAEDIDKTQKDLKEKSVAIKKSYDENVKKFRIQWDREISRLPEKMNSVKNKIVDDLAKEVSKKNMLELVGFPKKMARAINEKLQESLAAPVSQLGERLEGVIEKFIQDVDADVSVYCGNSSLLKNTLKDESGTILGLGVAGTGLTLGLGTSLAAVGTIQTAAVAATAATGATGAATASAGVIGTFFSQLFGVGAVSTSGAAAAAAGAALTTAITAAILPIVCGVTASFLAVKIGSGIAKGSIEKKIPDMVDQQFVETIKKVTELFAEIRENYIKIIENKLDDELSEIQTKMEEIKEAREKQDPSKIDALKNKVKDINEMAEELVGFTNTMQVL
jgi:GTPase SAR1 family protein